MLFSRVYLIRHNAFGCGVGDFHSDHQRADQVGEVELWSCKIYDYDHIYFVCIFAVSKALASDASCCSQMRPAARESRPGKLLGEAGRSTGSQVQAGRSTQIQNTKYKIQKITCYSGQWVRAGVCVRLPEDAGFSISGQGEKMQSKFWFLHIWTEIT